MCIMKAYCYFPNGVKYCDIRLGDLAKNKISQYVQKMFSMSTKYPDIIYHDNDKISPHCHPIFIYLFKFILLS